MNDTAWTDWNRDAEDWIPAIGERVRIWHPLPALGWCLLFGSVMGLTAFVATFGAAA